MRFTLLIAFAASFVLSGKVMYAQSTPGNENQINALVNKHVSINEKKQTMPGYRVQIYFGSKRDKATEIKNDFNQNFADIPVYLSYQQPNFKVRACDCKTRLEALKILDQVKKIYDVAFIVKDDVKLPDIK